MKEITIGPVPTAGMLYVVQAGEKRDGWGKINFRAMWRGGWVMSPDGSGWRHNGGNTPRAQHLHADIRWHLQRDLRDGVPFKIVEIT